MWTAHPFNFPVVADEWRIFLSTLGIARDQPAGNRLQARYLKAIAKWQAMRAVELFEAKSSYGKCHWFFNACWKKPLWFYCIVWFLRLDSLHFKSRNLQRLLLLNFLFLLRHLSLLNRQTTYRICSRNLRPRVFCAPQFLKDDFGFIFAPRISRTIVLFIYQ